MRSFISSLVFLAVAGPLAAQQPAVHADHAAHGGGLPAGWQARIDRDQAAANVMFMAMAGGFHATTGPAAVFFNPGWAHTGNYGVSATFTQNAAPAHPEAYGLVLGGSNLTAPEQQYTYFLVRGTGEFFIATRKGAQRAVVANWTAHEAIRKQDAAGKQVNTLGAQVRGDQVAFTVNGTEVARRSRSELLTDGVFGFRINHNLDVHVGQISR